MHTTPWTQLSGNISMPAAAPMSRQACRAFCPTCSVRPRAAKAVASCRRRLPAVRMSNPARCVSRGSGLQKTSAGPLRRIPCPQHSPGQGRQTGTLSAPITPGAPCVVSAAEGVGPPRSHPIRHRTAAGQCRGPDDQAAGPNCPTSWSVGTKNVSVVTNTGWRTKHGDA